MVSGVSIDKTTKKHNTLTAAGAPLNISMISEKLAIQRNAETPFLNILESQPQDRVQDYQYRFDERSLQLEGPDLVKAHLEYAKTLDMAKVAAEGGYQLPKHLGDRWVDLTIKDGEVA